MGCVKSKNIEPKLIPRSEARTTKVTHVAISKYTFAQTDRTVKIKIRIAGIQNHPKRKISLSASEFAFNFYVKKLNGKNWSLIISDLAHEIVHSKVSFVVKKDTVDLLLPKKHFAVWSSLHTRHSKDAPWNVDNLLKVGWAECLKEMGNKFHGERLYDEAIKKYSEAIRLAPNCPIYYSNRAASLMMIKKYREALEDSTKAIEVDRSFTKGYLRKGKIENILGLGPAALSTLKAGLEVHSNDEDLIDEMNKSIVLINSVKYGDKAFQDTKYVEANEHYASALMVAIESAELLFKKLEVMIYCGEDVDVLVLLRDLPEDSNWHYIMALQHYIKCDKNGAFLHINKTLGKDPKHSKGNDLESKMQIIFEIWEESKMACQEGNFDKAQMKLEKLLKLDPNNITLHAKAIVSVGLCFMEQGNYLKASVLFSRSIELRATNAMYFNRAKCFEYLGRTQECVNDYDRLYALSPTEENKALLNNAKANLMKVRGQNYYEIFGLQQDASSEAIRSAYQKLASECQPNYFSSGSEKVKEEQRYLEIHEAFYTLSDPMNRERYDRMSVM